jgi:hypothetical protein
MVFEWFLCYMNDYVKCKYDDYEISILDQFYLITLPKKIWQTKLINQLKKFELIYNVYVWILLCTKMWHQLAI